MKTAIKKEKDVVPTKNLNKNNKNLLPPSKKFKNTFPFDASNSDASMDDEIEEDYEPLAQTEEFEELEESVSDFSPSDSEETSSVEQYLGMFDNPGTYIFAGPTGSGKTYLVEALSKALVNKKKMFAVFVFSTSAQLNNDYKWIPKDMIFNNSKTINKDLIQWFKKRKNETVAARKLGLQAQPCIVIIDDPTGVFEGLSNVGSESNAITEWSTKCRKANLHLFLQTQRWNTYSTIARDNAHGFVLFSPKKEELSLFHANKNMTMPLHDFLSQSAAHFSRQYAFLIGLQQPYNGKKIFLCDPIEY